VPVRFPGLPPTDSRNTNARCSWCGAAFFQFQISRRVLPGKALCQKCRKAREKARKAAELAEVLA